MNALKAPHVLAGSGVRVRFWGSLSLVFQGFGSIEEGFCGFGFRV